MSIEIWDFHIMVGTKKLASFLEAIDGLVVEMKFVPVRNAKAKKGKVVQGAAASSVPEAILNHIRENNLEVIDTRAMKKIALDMGMSSGAHGYAIKVLVKDRLLKKGPKRKAGSTDPQVYHVLRDNLPV